MGKPPIPDAAMLRMYAVMQRLRTAKRDPNTLTQLSRKERADIAERPESLLAAVVSQMHRRDTLVLSGDDRLAKVAVCEYFPVDVSSLHKLSCSGEPEECAAFAAGIATRSVEAVRGAGPKPLTVVLLQSMPLLTGVLEMMTLHELPLIIVAEAEPDTRAEAQRRLLGTKVPILTVDRSDAVAICRVMQESTRRARAGLGGVVVHAIPMTGSADALAGLEERLHGRGLVAGT